MVLTNKDRKMVQDTWGQMKGDPKTNGMIWFKRMFEVYPEMKRLYRFLQGGPSDITKNAELSNHVARVYKKLDISIGQLPHPDVMAADLKTLGSRHPGYGVVADKHKQPTLEGLLFMLEKQLPSGVFTHDVHDAYVKTFDLICASMGIY